MGRATDYSGETHLGLQGFDVSFITNVLRFGEFRAAQALQGERKPRACRGFQLTNGGSLERSESLDAPMVSQSTDHAKRGSRGQRNQKRIETHPIVFSYRRYVIVIGLCYSVPFRTGSSRHALTLQQLSK
jgi:hypothetical protein